ncbi:hypothetical protein DFJ74DRAFT_647175 [Hyaloraphidium curvatum]|nr:hypothetical protein DFJ74DRAFT_647175 [Hyaloraphidium curvatum]
MLSGSPPRLAALLALLAVLFVGTSPSPPSAAAAPWPPGGETAPSLALHRSPVERSPADAWRVGRTWWVPLPARRVPAGRHAARKVNRMLTDFPARSCPGCTYDSGCCCPPRSRALTRTRTAVVSVTATRTRTVSSPSRWTTRTVTLTRGCPRLVGRDLLKQIFDGGPHDVARIGGGPGTSTVASSPDREPASEPSDLSDSDGNSFSQAPSDTRGPHALFARHICPACPAAVGKANTGSGGGANFCCPFRTVFRTVTARKTVRTKVITRTRTGGSGTRTATVVVTSRCASATSTRRVTTKRPAPPTTTRQPPPSDKSLGTTVGVSGADPTAEGANRVPAQRTTQTIPIETDQPGFRVRNTEHDRKCRCYVDLQDLDGLDRGKPCCGLRGRRDANHLLLRFQTPSPTSETAVPTSSTTNVPSTPSESRSTSSETAGTTTTGATSSLSLKASTSDVSSTTGVATSGTSSATPTAKSSSTTAGMVTASESHTVTEIKDATSSATASETTAATSTSEASSTSGFTTSRSQSPTATGSETQSRTASTSQTKSGTSTTSETASASLTTSESQSLTGTTTENLSRTATTSDSQSLTATTTTASESRSFTATTSETVSASLTTSESQSLTATTRETASGPATTSESQSLTASTSESQSRTATTSESQTRTTTALIFLQTTFETLTSSETPSTSSPTATTSEMPTTSSLTATTSDTPSASSLTATATEASSSTSQTASSSALSSTSETQTSTSETATPSPTSVTDTPSTSSETATPSWTSETQSLTATTSETKSVTPTTSESQSRTATTSEPQSRICFSNGNDFGVTELDGHDVGDAQRQFYDGYRIGDTQHQFAYRDNLGCPQNRLFDGDHVGDSQYRFFYSNIADPEHKLFDDHRFRDAHQQLWDGHGVVFADLDVHLLGIAEPNRHDHRFSFGDGHHVGLPIPDGHHLGDANREPDADAEPIADDNGGRGANLRPPGVVDRRLGRQPGRPGFVESESAVAAGGSAFQPDATNIGNARSGRPPCASQNASDLANYALLAKNIAAGASIKIDGNNFAGISGGDTSNLVFQGSGCGPAKVQTAAWFDNLFGRAEAQAKALSDALATYTKTATCSITSQAALNITAISGFGSSDIVICDLPLAAVDGSTQNFNNFAVSGFSSTPKGYIFNVQASGTVALGGNSMAVWQNNFKGSAFFNFGSTVTAITWTSQTLFSQGFLAPWADINANTGTPVDAQIIAKSWKNVQAAERHGFDSGNRPGFQGCFPPVELCP